jgi:hypothetical protein
MTHVMQMKFADSAATKEPATDEIVSLDDLHGPFDPLIDVEAGITNVSGDAATPVQPVEDIVEHEAIHPSDDHVEDGNMRLTPAPEASRTHAYSKVGVIPRGTYHRTMFSGTHRRRGPKLSTPGCRSLPIPNNINRGTENSADAISVDRKDGPCKRYKRL